MTKERAVDLSPLQVTTPEQFGQLLDLIHDEHFDLDQVQHHPEQGMVEIPFWRIFHGGPRRTVRNWLLYAVKEVDVVRAMMRIHHVDRYEVHDPEQIVVYSFNTVEYNQQSSYLMFQCEANLELRMKVSQLLIDCEDLEVRGKARISYFFGFVEGSSGRVYD